MNAREHALCDLVRLGLPTAVAETIVRQLPAIQRRHEASCNWPAHIAQPFAESGTRAFRRVVKLIDGAYHIRAQTDPRGCCVEVWPAMVTPAERESGEPLARLCARGFTARDIERIDAWQARIERAVRVAS